VEFLIADTFTASLARLSGEEQKQVKTTAFDLQLNPASPGHRLHRLEDAKDRDFWSVRAGRDLRVIVHRSAGRFVLCYVDHHDAAYRWAERRRLEAHPKTGAAQLVEIRETVRETVREVVRRVEVVEPAGPEGLVQAPARAASSEDESVLHGNEARGFSSQLPGPKEPAPPKRSSPKPALFRDRSESELLGYGVPAEWVEEVRQADEDRLLELADHLPAEAAEALLELATGGKPRPAAPLPTGGDPFAHPDAQRRFRVMHSPEELQRALESPWEKWIVFLHPEQRQWVERDYAGPARVSGSAGTGKTIVALHRTVHLARQHPDARVLLATFTDALASNLAAKLRRLIGGDPRLAERIDTYSLTALGLRLHRAHIGPAELVSREELRRLLEAAAAAVPGHRFQGHFLIGEWEQVVDAWQLDSFEAYRDVPRLGRKVRLPEPQRRILWTIFERVRQDLEQSRRTTESAVFTRLAGAIARIPHPPYEFAVIDEAQDLSIAQLRFFAALGQDRPNALFFAGDIGQRIFQNPFSWKSLGVDIRGRSRTLRINYRTSHQIRQQADRLLARELTDPDGNAEDRSDTISVFNGPPPEIRVLPDEPTEIATVATWIRARLASGTPPHAIGLFVRTPELLPRAIAAATAAGHPHRILDTHLEPQSGHLSLATMHLAKGLEFSAVAILACDEDTLPLRSRLESASEPADLQDLFETERHLLYVAATRARDHLLITASGSASEFIADFA
jgi:hypothetical protein